MTAQWQLLSMVDGPTAVVMIGGARSGSEEFERSNGPTSRLVLLSRQRRSPRRRAASTQLPAHGARGTLAGAVWFFGTSTVRAD
jgi:hypothetical protein